MRNEDPASPIISPDRAHCKTISIHSLTKP
jgi:hypothetical protein